MNSLILKIVIGGFLLSLVGGLYFVVKQNGKLESENDSLTETIDSNKNAIFILGNTIQNLQSEYEQAGNDEFKKFNESDINKIPMDDIVSSYNDGIKRVLKDYKNRTTEFIKGNTKTTSP